MKAGFVCASLMLLLASCPLSAQVTGRGSFIVTVTSQNGSIRLPGVSITVTSLGGHTVATDISDGEGRLYVSDLPPGLYEVRASLMGFDDERATVRVEADREARVNLDLPLTGLTERVDVIGNAETAPPTIGETLSTKGVLESRVVEQLPIRDRSVLSALKLLAGVVDGPGGVSIKGGRSNQSGLQIGMAALTDSSTNAPLFRLPVDAIDSIEVLPNPYAVEFGRFSSGVTVVNTKRAGDTWRVDLSAPDLSFRNARGKPWTFTGIESFGPRIGFGGPLVKGRLFLEQSAQMRYEVSEVWDRPTDQTRDSLWLSTFTRVDANLSPSHSLIASFNFFPSRANAVTLGTFNGPDVTADQHDRLLTGSFAAHTVLSGTSVLESTLQFNGFRINVGGHGPAPMELIPSGNAGNFFNRSNRATESIQWVEAATGTGEWAGMSHLFKVGADLMHTSFQDRSNSSPVLIRRDDGTLARRLTFTGPIEQKLASTDLAVFAEDRIQVHRRVLLEVGGRIDRDGVLKRINATPRVGAVFLLDERASAALRGGFGLFYERTPSVVGAFDRFEAPVETRYAADGVTPLGPPRTFQHVTAPHLDVARSTTWNTEYTQRLPHALSVRAGVLGRHGTHDLIVIPAASSDPSRGELRLTSEGGSSYVEGEVTLRYAPGPRLELSGSYVRSSASADLNVYTAFFDNVRWPVIGANFHAPQASDTPHRFVAHTRTIFANTWLVSSIFEAHSGFPYSATNDMLDWVGERNRTYHFPTFVMLDLDVEHKFTFLKGKPWIGLRAYNALNRFTPIEVQSNVSSRAFGSFYNSYGRQIRLQVRFDH